MRQSIAAAIVAYLMVFAGNCSATLIGLDLNAPGDQLLTLDTLTGLEWLDLTATLNLSAVGIMSDAGGWSSGGFVYATTDQVRQLFLDSDPPNSVGGVSPSNRTGALTLLSLLGTTYTNPGPGTNGFDILGNGIEGIGEPGPGLAYFADYGTNSAVSFGFLYVADGHASTSYQDPFVGSFLIKTSVPIPEPSTLGLVGLGIIALV